MLIERLTLNLCPLQSTSKEQTWSTRGGIAQRESTCLARRGPGVQIPIPPESEDRNQKAEDRKVLATSAYSKTWHELSPTRQNKAKSVLTPAPWKLNIEKENRITRSVPFRKETPTLWYTPLILSVIWLKQIIQVILSTSQDYHKAKRVSIFMYGRKHHTNRVCIKRAWTKHW